MNIQEIRLQNLHLLIEEFGTIAKLARAAETPPNYLSQILNGVETSLGRPRGVGHALAEKLEIASGKPKGWMDRYNGANEDINNLVSIYSELTDDLKLNLMEFSQHLQEKSKKKSNEDMLDKLYGHAKPIHPAINLTKNKKLFIKN